MTATLSCLFILILHIRRWDPCRVLAPGLQPPHGCFFYTPKLDPCVCVVDSPEVPMPMAPLIYGQAAAYVHLTSHERTSIDSSDILSHSASSWSYLALRAWVAALMEGTSLNGSDMGLWFCSTG